ncbi:glycosyltransferase family 2 protein [bacterium]|nr:glycosyltransferase family 2 protein [bacterium]
MTPGIDVSVVVPCFDESESLPALIDGIVESLNGTGRSFEIVVVDDGSHDGSFDVVRERAAADTRVRGLRFRRNFGKSAALSAGFESARGDVVLTLDADLQDDPLEIPRFLAAIDGGLDLVSGWKRERHDPVEKTLPSRLFNAVTAKITGIPLHDFNCGFKAYRREVLEDIDLYGEQHRFIPVLAGQRGYRIGEIDVRHHPRRHGRSKFGAARYLRGAADLLTIVFLTRYFQRPGHLFGGGGFLLGGLGLAICAYMSALWFAGERPIGNRPLLLLGILLIITGVQFVSIGLIGEMLAKRSHRKGATYSVAERVE